MLDKPQLTESDIQRISDLVKQKERQKESLANTDAELSEYLESLIDDPYFTKNKSIEFASFGISIGVTQPTIKDKKWIAKKRETLKKEMEELAMYEENYTQHGDTVFKSKPRPYAKIITNK